MALRWYKRDISRQFNGQTEETYLNKSMNAIFKIMCQYMYKYILTDANNVLESLK